MFHPLLATGPATPGRQLCLGLQRCRGGGPPGRHHGSCPWWTSKSSIYRLRRLDFPWADHGISLVCFKLLVVMKWLLTISGSYILVFINGNYGFDVRTTGYYGSCWWFIKSKTKWNMCIFCFNFPKYFLCVFWDHFQQTWGAYVGILNHDLIVRNPLFGFVTGKDQWIHALPSTWISMTKTSSMCPMATGKAEFVERFKVERGWNDMEHLVWNALDIQI